MGEHEPWSQPSGLLPNGLLPNQSNSVIRVLDAERWSKAEEATAQIIACIQPNQLSEERRNAVANYVQRLIMKCFPCQVFTFGSVPLKTYLPDGDIDLTAFSENQVLKDTWATKVRDVLESEEKNENAEFHVKEVQYIQAEVKIIKCLVENIVVDISFNQLGGLCTLCFLEEVDLLINQNHLFKRSIILIKAWCYYESRILGAHHGLISTYALETLVLYIFHVFNNSFAGPLEVLYRFLEFFSNFDWENFCLSLWGPVPISSLPDVTAEPPRKDGAELLLSKLFLDACSTVYAVFPGGQDNQGQPFVSKHFNVIDPLRVNNNLGRSVSKGNFFRIRSAFAFGTKRLARLLDCPKEDVALELNQFFMNTWERHGSGKRPDAPFGDLRHLWQSNSDYKHGLDNQTSTPSSKKMNEDSSAHDTEVEGPHIPRAHLSRRVNYPLENKPKSNDASASFHLKNQKISGGLSNSRTHDENDNCNQEVQVDRGQQNIRFDQMMNEAQGKYLFARTRSSPELHTYSGGASRAKAAESGKFQFISTKMDDPRMTYLAPESCSNQKSISYMGYPSAVGSMSSYQRFNMIADSNCVSSSCVEVSGVGSMNEELASSMGLQGMHQEEQDRVNMMAAPMHSFGGHFPMPLNLASAHAPISFPPSMLASIAYAQRNLGGIVPANTPLLPNGQFHQGLVSSPLVASNSQDQAEQGNENLGSSVMADSVYFHDRAGTSSVIFGPDDSTCELLRPDDRQSLISTSLGPVSPYGPGGSSSSMGVLQKLAKENPGLMREQPIDSYQHEDNIIEEPDDRISRSRLTSNASSRSKTSSESSWDGSSGKEPKMTRERRGKTAVPAAQPVTSGKGKCISDHAFAEADDQNGDWNTASIAGSEMADSNMMFQAALHVPRRHTSSHEIMQTNETDPILPIPPMRLGPRSQQRMMDNSGAVPIFYPTGPPVPFLTMVPVSYFPTETRASDVSKSHMSGDVGLDSNDSGQSIGAAVINDEVEGLNASNYMQKVTTINPLEVHNPDILNSDIHSHWQNLQYGRFCQNTHYPGPVICPSPVVVPPVYLQGRFPWDGPGSPLAANMNLFSQLMGYGPRHVPAAPLQSVSSRPDGSYQRYVDELPRYRSGTGTYLPNPASTRERHMSGGRRSNYNHDWNDHHHGDREGNWNTNSKPRAAGRCHNRGQTEKSRPDRFGSNESRADRPWGSYRNESLHSQHSQDVPMRHSSSQNTPGNIAYGMYPLNPNGMSLNGPSVVMLYPYDHSPYTLPSEQLEFGSHGPVGFAGMSDNESPQMEGNHAAGLFDEQSFHGAPAQRPSPDQPSSPHIQRRG